MPSGPAQDLIRMPEDEIRGVIARLDTSQSQSNYGNRTGVRWKLQFQKAVLTTTDNYGERHNTVIIPRNISAYGIGFLYGGYLHTEQPCTITIRTKTGSARCLSGRIVRCSHITGRIHEVGIRFDHAISPLHFMIEDRADRSGQLENIDPQAIEGRVLLLSADELLLSALRETKILVIPAPNAEIIPQLLLNKPDTIILDESATREAWKSLIPTLRTRAYTGPLILVVSDSSPEFFVRATNLGCSDLLIRPFKPKDVFCTLAQHLVPDDIFHKLMQSDMDDALAGEILGELERSSLHLRSHIESRDLAAALKSVSSIAALAEQLGIEVIENLTDQCIELLNLTGLNGAGEYLDQLIHNCNQAALQTQDTL